MKTAAIYARVSTSKQAQEGYSLDGQVDACRKYATDNGYLVTHIEKEDISGSRLDRPGLDRIRDAAAKGEIDAVIVWDIDRLSRDMAHQYILDSEFERRKVRLIFVNSPFEDNPSGKAFLGMKRVFAEFEKATITDRFRRGKDRAARGGAIQGSAAVPFGYEYIPRKKGGDGDSRQKSEYRIIESEAHWVRQMFHWIVSYRMSLGEVARRLNAASVPTKRGASHWEPSTVRRIITNPLYTGDWVWNKTEAVVPAKPSEGARPKKERCSTRQRPQDEWIRVEDCCPAIVSHDIFEAAQVQIRQNKALAGRMARREHLLKGMLVCAYCGRRLVGKGSENPKYVCTGLRDAATKGHVHAPRIDAGKVESEIWRKVAAKLSDKQRIKDALSTRAESLEELKRRDEQQLADLVRQEQAISRERHLLIDWALAEPPKIDDKTLQERQEMLTKKQSSIGAARVEIDARIRQREVTRLNEEALDLACDLAQEGLHLFDAAERRDVLRALDLKGTVDHDRIEFTWLLADPIIVLLGEKLEGQTETPNNLDKLKQSGRTVYDLHILFRDAVLLSA